MKHVFYKTVKDQKVQIDETLSFQEGERVQVKIERIYSPRSNEQNRYYWGVLLKIFSEETGYTQQELHEALKYEFLKKDMGRLTGAKSTKELNTKEFNDYISTVRNFASRDFGCYIPSPGEVEWLSQYEWIMK